MDKKKIAIVGAKGEFGQFLQHDILSGLGVSILEPIERDTSRESRGVILEKSRHVVIATPLAGYAEVACDLIYHLRHCDHQEIRTRPRVVASQKQGCLSPHFGQ